VEFNKYKFYDMQHQKMYNNKLCSHGCYQIISNYEYGT